MIDNGENLTELPKGWAGTQVGEIACLVRGVTYKKQEASGVAKEGYLPILRANNINARINFDELVYVPAERISPEQFVETLDIVVAMSSGSKDLVGKAAQSLSSFGGGFGTFCGLVRPSKLSNGKFLGYFFQSPRYRRAIALSSSGVNINNLRREHIETMPIPVAPLAEQKRIVAKIEELFTWLDAGVEALKKVKAELKRYRRAVLKAAFEGKLTAEWRQRNKDKLEPASKLLERIAKEREKAAPARRGGKGKAKKLPPLDTSELPELPEGWEWARVGEIGEAVTGTTPSKKETEYYGNDYPFFKPTDLNAGYYVRVSADNLSNKGIENARLLPGKSILVTCIGATIGKTGFIRSAGASNQQINAIIPLTGVMPEYAYFNCISPQFQKSILDNASATTLPILNKGRFELLSLPLCCEPEQKAIVQEIERHFSIADEVEQTIEKSLKESQRLRQSILKRAFEGKLVPQNANDEPAEELLRRIKTEKAKRR